MTLNAFYISGPLCREFTFNRWIPSHKGSYSDVMLNILLNKHYSCRPFETPCRSCDVTVLSLPLRILKEFYFMWVCQICSLRNNPLLPIHMWLENVHVIMAWNEWCLCYLWFDLYKLLKNQLNCQGFEIQWRSCKDTVMSQTTKLGLSELL